ncbi:hypothetical protein HMY34_20030 (plasmid) [Thiothrix subterranea]|uniref:hypothetical protein n=1 Tax=Thiothrix subterranea TaxID=2735563 RepID=UPI00192C7417|nr:hypothetical protein [Thiothrix subterranea]QQZ31114.1 hypothetical protein HMY34_20030 [Thiothrix subterranea]
MSMFLVTGEVRNVFKQPGSVDKTTGEQRPDSNKVQILGELPVMGGGTREDIITLTIPDGLDFSPYLKQRVSVPIGFLSPAKGSIVYFIPKGSQINSERSTPHLETPVIKSPLNNSAVKSPLGY